MLKVLYLPIGWQTGTIDAWNATGVKLQVYDYHGEWDHTKSRATVCQKFLHHVKEFQPNLIHMQLQFTDLISPSILEEARKLSPGVVISNWTGDVRASAQPNFITTARAVDYSLISSTGQLEMYKQAGCPNVKYWQIGYDPNVSYPMNKETFKYDISFAANNYGPTFPDGHLRLEAANQLRSAFGTKFGLFGSGYSPAAPMIEPQQTNNLYNDSICALSISNFNNVSHYFSDRLLYCLASGRPTISWHFPGFESYFIEGKEIFIARSVKEIIDIVHYCKANPEVAKQVGMNGYQRALKEHTYTSRIIELLHITNLIHLV